MTKREHNKLKRLFRPGYIAVLIKSITNEQGKILPRCSLIVLLGITDDGEYHIAGYNDEDSAARKKDGLDPEIYEFQGVSYKCLYAKDIIDLLSKHTE